MENLAKLLPKELNQKIDASPSWKKGRRALIIRKMTQNNNNAPAEKVNPHFQIFKDVHDEVYAEHRAHLRSTPSEY